MDVLASASSNQGDFLGSAGGATGSLIRSKDWSATSLGPVDQWPQSLKLALRIMLSSRYQMWLGWGPDLTFFCNDAYSPTLGAKYPWALGQPTKKVWVEIWESIEPLIRSVIEKGQATYDEALMLFLTRHGYAEETYHTFSYSPLPDDNGGIGGMLCVVVEDTQRYIGERRMRMLRDFATASAKVRTHEELVAVLEPCLSSGPQDLPFSLLYTWDHDGTTAHLVASTGIDRAHPAARASLTTTSDAAPWSRSELHAPTLISDVGARFSEPLPRGPWEKPPQDALILPLAQQGQGDSAGFFIIGLNPHRPLDDDYRGFLDLLADQIASGLSRMRAYEEERRRAEALAEIDRAKTAFFSNVSHEFRTPLTLMLGPTEDALASGDGALRGPALETVHRNALRLLKLVNTLLDFSRIEAGRAQASYQPTNLATLTASYASAFRSAFDRANLAFVVDCPALPELIYVDPSLWEKVVLNLLSNALKFTFEGEIAVQQRWAGDHVELSVRDTGTGIPEHEIPHLFERFRRVQGARSRTHEGSGIGLALVHEIVRMHGGRIRVESRENEGTTFTVSIPTGSAHLASDRVSAERTLASTGTGSAPYLEEALRWLPRNKHATAPHEKAPEQGAALTSTAGLRILVADDNADMREYLERLLSGRWDVSVFPDGAAALDAAIASPPSLVITDVMMPILDGFGLLRELRKNPSTRDVPVLMLSARAGDEASIDGLNAGADDYLVKPFSAGELLARVDKHLALSQARVELERERSRLLHLLKHVPVVINFLRGPDMVFEVAHPIAVAKYGGRALEGKPVLEAIPELQNQPFLKQLHEVYATGETRSGHEALSLIRNPATGQLEESYWTYSYIPVHDADGAVEGVMTCDIEVTEQVLARRDIEQARAEAEAANRAKDEFLAMLGHELRNPLAPIITALHLMRLRGYTMAEKERTIIERQVNHMVRLVDDLLDVSRITRGKIELRKARVEMSEIVAKAIEMASPLLDQRRHNLSVDVARSGLAVNGDAVRLAQVVSNLVTNAAKYTEKGGQITIAGRAERGHVVIDVRDTGIGIAPEMLPKIFDLFVQERQASDRAQGGLGLGLTIARSFATMHDGALSVHSEGVGRGSTFTLRLPSADAAEEPRAATDRPTVVPSPPVVDASSCRILVVDDNEDAAQMLVDTLNMLGYTTRVAHNGPAALEIAQSFEPHVALLDIGLPVMDGHELARRLRQQPWGSRGLLVAVTGYGQEPDRHRSRSAGFDEHLVKPIDVTSLDKLIRYRLATVAATR